MTDTKHPPGPWAWLDGDTLLANYGARRVVLCGQELKQCGEDGLLHDLDPEGASARLIAAAPALLAACETTIDRYAKDQAWPSPSEIRAMNSAIAMAKVEA